MTGTTLAENLTEAFERCRDMDGSLPERLAHYSDAVRQLLPPYAAAVDRLVVRLRASGAGERAPAVGDPMPTFVLPDEQGRMVDLAELLRTGPVAITFNRGHWCPWCRISITALARAQREILAAGGQCVAIMPDRQQFAAQFKAEAGAPCPVLTDLDNGYAMSLNLVIWVGPEIEELLKSYGRTLPEYQGNESWMLPIPATFVVGSDGRVIARFVDPDFRQRMAVENLVAALRSAR